MIEKLILTKIILRDLKAPLNNMKICPDCNKKYIKTGRFLCPNCWKKMINTSVLCSRKTFFDYIEKAETGAIGRALSSLGYGTLQCFDVDVENMKNKVFRITLTCEICRTAENKEFTFEEDENGKLFVSEDFNCNRCYAHGLSVNIEEV